MNIEEPIFKEASNLLLNNQTAVNQAEVVNAIIIEDGTNMNQINQSRNIGQLLNRTEAIKVLEPLHVEDFMWRHKFSECYDYSRNDTLIIKVHTEIILFIIF